MSQRPTIREQMDACRPDSDDLHLPEHAADLAELQAVLRDGSEVRRQWEQNQVESRLIRGAMQDVSLPAGLEARLLAAVQAAEIMPISSVEIAAQENMPAADVAMSPEPAQRLQPNRRRIIQVASGLAALASLALVGFFGYRSLTQTQQSISREQLVSRAEEWLRNVDELKMTPAAKPNQAAPGGFVRGAIVRSKTFNAGADKITAYSLKLQGNSKTAILLEIPASQIYPVNALPYSSLTGVSGGWTVGAWQRDGVLYVIAVRGDARLDDFAPLQPIG